MKKNTKQLVLEYVELWRQRGYPDDIPDECPDVLMKLGLAPSYKAIALAILRNDLNLTSLGFSTQKSIYYNILKNIELEARKSCNT